MDCSLPSHLRRGSRGNRGKVLELDGRGDSSWRSSKDELVVASAEHMLEICGNPLKCVTLSKGKRQRGKTQGGTWRDHEREKGRDKQSELKGKGGEEGKEREGKREDRLKVGTHSLD